MKPAIRLFFLFGLFLNFHTLHAQISDPTITITEILEDSILWDDYFPLSEIPNRSQETLDFTDVVTKGLGTRELEDIFKDEWDSVSTDIRKKDQEFVIDSTTRLGPSAIQNRLREWTIMRDKLTTWNNELTEDISWIADENKLFTKLVVTWNKTRQHALAENAAPTVVERINEVRGKVRSVSKQIDNNFNMLLDRQVELSDLTSIIDKKIIRLNEEKEYSVKSYLLPDRPMLWTEIAIATDSTAHLPETINKVISNRKSEFNRFFFTNRYHLLSSFVLFIVLSLLLTILKKRSAIWFDNFEEGSDYDNATIKIINRPIPVSFVLSVVILSSFILPTVPLFFIDFLWFITLVPILLVLLPVTPKEFHKYIIILSAIAIINRIDNLIYELPVLARLIILTNSIIIAGVLIWMSYQKVQKTVKHKTLLYGLLNLLRIFGLISMPIAVIANIIGNTTLAEFLVNGYVDSLLSVLFIFILLLVFRSLNDVILLSPFVRKSNVVIKHSQTIEDSLNAIVYWALLILLLSNIAEAFLIEEEVYAAVSSIFLTPVEFGSISITLMDILLFLFMIWLSLKISRIISVILEEDVLTRTKTSTGISATIVSMTKTAILILGFVLAFAASGFELSSITLLVSAFGVGIGFGLQNIFNNFVSGIIIATERPVEVGDTIQVGQLTGNVKSVGLRSSVVRTWDGSEVIVPNGNLISNDLINWTHSDRQIRISIPFGVAYGSDPHKTIEIAKAVTDDTSGILKFPSSYVLFLGFGDSSLDFILRFWTDDYDNWIFLKSEITLKVHDALYENGIEIPFPQRDLHLRSIDDKVITDISPEQSSKNLKILEEQYKKEETKKISGRKKKVEKEPEKPIEKIDSSKDDEESEGEED